MGSAKRYPSPTARTAHDGYRLRLNPSYGHADPSVVCGVRVEDVDDPLMQKVRYPDKLVDELAKGKALEKILR